MKRISTIALAVLLLMVGVLGVSYAQAPDNQVSLPQGTVLRLALSARTSVGKVGQKVDATVVEPVYLYDKLVIPMNTKARGRIIALHAVPRGERILAISGGDFTPLKDPEIQFDELILQSGEVLPIHTDAIKRNTQVVELRDPRRKGDSSIKSMLKSQMRGRLGLAGGPGIFDHLKNTIFENLPYHPQVLDRGSLFDGVLMESVTLSLPSTPAVDCSHLGEPIPDDTRAHARLLTGLSSEGSVEGTVIKAVLTEPIWGSDHELLYPEGAELLGTVIRSKPAGGFGRSGELRLAFTSLRLPAGDETPIEVQIEALEARRNAHVTIDAEGGTKAHPGQRFIGPLYSAFLAGASSTSGHSRIKRAIVSHGFGIVGRIAGIAGTSSVSSGISYYGLARSVYLHILRKGPEVDFPVNTRLDIRLTQREQY